jgi:gliding motility-associated-like protein
MYTTKKIIKNLSLLIFMMVGYIAVHAQGIVLVPPGLVPSSNAYMAGYFLEVGVSDCGTYGTRSGAVPAGYHPRPVGLNGIGFVADVGRNGWSTPGPGSNPDFCGDYFLPGSPVEGWGVQIGATSYINSDRCGINQIPGALLSYASIGGQTVVWEGTTIGAMPGLRISQTTTFPDSALYFVTKVEFTNTTGATMTDVFYARNVDPDNDQPISGDFTTRNTIVSQPNASQCDALVTAVGLSPGCFLGIGARSQNARVSKGSFSTTPPISSYYMGTSSHDTFTGGVSTADEAISIGFNLGNILPGQTVTAAFAHILNPSDLAIALESTGGAFISSDSLDITPTLSDTICPGDFKELVITSDTQYHWTWSPNYNIDTLEGTIVNVHPDTTTTYIAIGTDGPCGTIQRDIMIYVDTNVNVNAGPDDTICLGSSAQLRATRASFFTWTPSSTLNNDSIYNPIATPAVTTTYYAASNCGMDSVRVFVAPVFGLDFTPDTAICFSDLITLRSIPTIGGTYTYDWTRVGSGGGTLTGSGTSTPYTNVTGTVTYRAHVVSDAGCEVDSFVTLSVRGTRPAVTLLGDTSAVCRGDSVGIFGSVIPGTCNVYTTSILPASSIPGSGSSVSLADNQLSAAIPLGGSGTAMSFNFFCNTYQNAYICSNGFITFDPLAGTGFAQSIPSTLNPSDLIAGAWLDLNPTVSGATIDTRTIGTDGSRQFIVNYNDVYVNRTSDAVKFQIVLHEGTNLIDINTTYTGSLTNATQGIENSGGTAGYATTGRNLSSWRVLTPESRRWTPTVPFLTYSWTPSTGLTRTDTSTTTAIVGPGRTYQLIVSDSGCTGSGLFTTHEDTTLRIVSFNNDTLLCHQSQPVQLNAVVVYDSIADTFNYCDRYSVVSIPFAPVAGSGTALSLSDDQLTGSIPFLSGSGSSIPFEFDFYCVRKSNVYISSNGFITFNPGSGSGCCSGQLLPNISNPNDVIAAGWDDLYPPGGGPGRIEYYISGTFPNRIFVVNWNDVPLCCSGPAAFKGQIVLYERTNIIEVFNTYANNMNPATLGIENASGTLGLAAPGRNQSNWGSSVRSEGWRFAPDYYIIPAGTLSHDWSPPTGLSDTSSLSPIATVGVTTTYILHVTDGHCDRYDTMTIVVDSLPYTISNDTSICYGESVNLLATATSGASFNWTPTTYLSPSGIVANPTSRPDSTITYYLRIVDTLGCFKDDSVNILVHQILPIDLSPDATYLCAGDSQLYDATNPYFVSYIWNSNISLNTGSIQGRTTGQYYVVATDSFNCKSNSDTVFLRMVPYPRPNITFTPGDSFCPGTTVDLSVLPTNALTTISWNTVPVGTTSTITVGTEQLYIVTLTDSGCATSDSQFIAAKYPDVLNTIPDTFVCCPSAYTIRPGGGALATYTWSPPLTTSSTLDATVSGTYIVTVTAANGCTSTTSMTLTRFCIDPIASASPDSVFVNDSTLLNVVTSYVDPSLLTYSWTPTDYLSSPSTASTLSRPTSATPDSRTYSVIVSDLAHGCIDTSDITIHIKPLGFYEFPDAFTPNGDGLNDYYYPLVTTGATILEFRIFNRWGDVVYSGTSTPGWDGRFMGADQPIGSYVYFVRVSYPDERDASIMLEATYTGTITLIR